MCIVVLKQSIVTEIGLQMLPVILEARLGTKIWNWFSEEAKELSAGYYWDAVDGLKSTEDDRTTALLGDWGAE
jgi:uncharacterized protein YfaQ (DUF2300 family)